MQDKNLTVAEAPLYSEATIKKLHQLLQDKVAEVQRLQREGKLPYYKRFPKSIVETGDLKIIFNKSERTAQRQMARIRKKLGKAKDEFVSVTDFCKATGLDERSVQRALDMCT